MEIINIKYKIDKKQSGHLMSINYEFHKADKLDFSI